MGALHAPRDTLRTLHGARPQVRHLEGPPGEDIPSCGEKVPGVGLAAGDAAGRVPGTTQKPKPLVSRYRVHQKPVGCLGARKSWAAGHAFSGAGTWCYVGQGEA